MHMHYTCHNPAGDFTRSCTSKRDGESIRSHARLPLATQAVRGVLNRTWQAVHQRSYTRQVTCAQAGSKKENISPRPAPVCTSLQSNSLGKRRTRSCQSKAQQTSNTAVSQDRHTNSASGNGWAWLLGSLTLSLGTGLPALYIATHFSEITQMTSAQRTAGIAAADSIFILSATAFLYFGDKFGVQRNGTTPRFPGPMIELDGQRRAPGFFQEYLIGIVLTTILAPVLGLGLLIKDGNTYLGLSTLGVYLLCLFVQIATESITLRTGTPMWAQVPQAYQPYRLYQLARGLALTSATDSPEWLQTLQGALVIIWLFNYGAQMQFTPWIYRWHLQPSDSEQQ